MKAFKTAADMSPEELKRARERALIALPARFRDRCQRCGELYIALNGSCANRAIHADWVKEFEAFQAETKGRAA